MSSKLSPAQVAQYHRDGFLFPISGITEPEAASYRGALEAYERAQGTSITGMTARYKSHTLFPWANRLVREPAILDAVEDLIGADILVWTSTFFVKEPKTPAITAWHQDWTFFGLRPHEHVTAWVALSSASVEAGCMRFVPGQGAAREMRHTLRADPNSINGGGQKIGEPFDESRAVHGALRPGEFSLHHTLCIHSSPPNRSGDRRIGLGISYIPAGVRHTGTIPVSALLVRGEDRFGHFRLEEDPTGDHARDAARQAEAYASYRAAYNEQIRWHESGRAA
jgi:hypothetical protein